MKGKRTGLEFEDHELKVILNDEVSIYHLKKKDTSIDNIKYINVHGILAVKGDYGNWIFCREFHPTHDGYVSSQYWVEKLKIASTQEPYEFDSEATEKEIRKLLAEEENLTEEEKEYLDGCLRNLGDGEFDYTHYAHRENVGRFDDHEHVPHEKRLKYWLQAVFDGFDEICRRMKVDADELAKQSTTTTA